MKKCPFCEKELEEDATKCRYCNEMLISEEEVTDLFGLIESGDLAAVEEAVKNGVSPMERGNAGWTPLHFAAQEGQLDIAGYLIREGADVNAANDEQWTPLHLAVQEGDVDMAELLLSHDANPDVRNEDDIAPIDIAIDYNNRYNRLIAMLMPAVEEESAEEEEESGDPGEEVPGHCSSCGNENDVANEFCGHCGARLAG